MDNSWDFIITYTPVIIATVTGVIGTVLGVYNFIQRQKDRKPRFEHFQRKKDTVGSWYIFLHSPSKPIRRCNVTFKDQQLQIRDEKGYEKTMPSGGGGNFTMPLGVSDDDSGFVVVRDGKKVIEKERFSKMISG